MSEQADNTTPTGKRRSLRRVWEVCLAAVAIACAIGWAREHEARTRLASFQTVDEAIARMGDEEKQIFVDYQRFGDGIARYWLVRERDVDLSNPAPDYVPAPRKD